MHKHKNLRMRIWLPVVLSFLYALTSPAWGAESRTLGQSMIDAYLSNPTLMAQRAKVRSVDEQLPQALSGWRPTAEVSADNGTEATFSNVSTSDKRRQHRDPRSLSLTLSQPIYSGGQTLAATSKAENLIMAERAQLKVIEQSVLLSAVNAYVDVFRDQAVLALDVNNEQVLKRQLEATRDRFQVGEITRTDVHQAEARLAQATADRIGAEGNQASSRAAFENVVGHPPDRLKAPELPMDPPESKDTAAAITRNPKVIAAEYRERALLDEVEKTKGELLPSVNLSGTASRSFNASGEATRFDSYVAKLTLTMPIYQAGSVYSNLRQARQDAVEQRRKLDQERRNATEQATRSREAIRTARARIKSFRTQIKSSEVALEGIKREATVGSRTVLDILDAEQELLDAKVNMVKAQRDEIIAVFELKEAMGSLTIASMGLSVDAYDPIKHYQEVQEKWFGGNSSGEID